MESTHQVEPASGERLSPTLMLGELHAMLAALSSLSKSRPEQTTRGMLELANAMRTACAAIERGYCTADQLASLTRRRVGLERQVP